MFCLLSLQTMSQIRSAKLQASGLTCAMCARAVYKNLESLPFIKTIGTDLNGSSFLLEFNEGKVDLGQIRKKVEDAGFSVAALEIQAHMNVSEIAPDAHVEIGGDTYHFLTNTRQSVSSDQKLSIVDKGFVSAKEVKKMEGLTKMSCYRTGVMASCCQVEGHAATGKLYHVTLLP